jgi:hypothetical protein
VNHENVNTQLPSPSTPAKRTDGSTADIETLAKAIAAQNVGSEKAIVYK